MAVLANEYTQAYLGPKRRQNASLGLLTRLRWVVGECCHLEEAAELFFLIYGVVERLVEPAVNVHDVPKTSEMGIIVSRFVYVRNIRAVSSGCEIGGLAI